MPVAVFKDICIDAVGPDPLGRFWAEVLGREFHPAEGPAGARITGPTPEHLIWVNEVPEPHTVKGRVHLDIYAAALEPLYELGATQVADHPDWTILADPEGNEFCAFLCADVPAERLHGLVVDCGDPDPLARWWAEVYGADLDTHDGTWATLERVPGMPILTMDFVPVPEPKTVKNRVHWDVWGNADDLVAGGATVVRRRDERIGWDVLADPAGNEFCVFTPRPQ